MPKFEHTIITVGHEAAENFDPDFVTKLNQMEDEGWTIVTAYGVPAPASTIILHYYVYRRELPASAAAPKTKRDPR